MPVACFLQEAVLIGDAINAVREQATLHFGIGDLLIPRYIPGDDVTRSCRLKHDVFTQLVRAAPDEHFAATSVRYIAEGHYPNGIIAVTATQHIDNGVQPILVIDPGGRAAGVQLDLTFRYLPAAHGSREEVITAARRRAAQLAGPTTQPLKMVPGHRLDHPGKPH